MPKRQLIDHHNLDQSELPVLHNLRFHIAAVEEVIPVVWECLYQDQDPTK